MEPDSQSDAGKPASSLGSHATRTPKDATSRDVAKAAGVSQATVSRVLHNHPRVAPDTRERVLKAVEETGYIPNLLARAMRTKRTGTIGVVVDRITNPFYPEVVEALAHRLALADFRMILWTSDHAGEASALESIQQGLVDGLVFTTISKMTSPLAEAKKRNAAMVLVNRGLDDLDCDQVMSDNVGGAAAVANYFHYWGRRRLAHIGAPETASTARERMNGFKLTLRELGAGEPIEEYGDFSHKSAYEATRRILAGPVPDAIFCVNDIMAMGALDAARTEGLQLPGDCWVVGYDDIDMASWQAYDLTTVRQPIREMADRSVSLLLERIDHPSKSSERVRFPSQLVVRGSTEHRPSP